MMVTMYIDWCIMYLFFSSCKIMINIIKASCKWRIVISWLFKYYNRNVICQFLLLSQNFNILNDKIYSPSTFLNLKGTGKHFGTKLFTILLSRRLILIVWLSTLKRTKVLKKTKQRPWPCKESFLSSFLFPSSSTQPRCTDSPPAGR